MNRSGLFRSAGTDRAVISTVAPARVRRLAIASPMPAVPPVTRMRLPSRSLTFNGGSVDPVIGSFRRLTREAHQRRFLVLPSGSVLGQTGSLLPLTSEALFTEESVPQEWRHPYVTFQRNDEQWCESLAEHADAALLARAPSPQRQDSRSHAPATRTPVVEHAHIAILPLRHSAGCEAPVAGRFPGSALHEPSDGYVPLGAQGARVQGWKKAPLPQGPGLFVPPENGQHGTCAFLDAHTSTPHNTRDPARYA